MKVLITFKVGKEGEWIHTRHYDFDQADFQLLRRDFLDCLNAAGGALQGASYRCIDPDTNQSRELFLRFDDILYLECVSQDPSLASQSTTRPITTTGPLHSRIASANSSEE
jgi:hypothetical protein